MQTKTIKRDVIMLKEYAHGLEEQMSRRVEIWEKSNLAPLKNKIVVTKEVVMLPITGKTDLTKYTEGKKPIQTGAGQGVQI